MRYLLLAILGFCFIALSINTDNDYYAFAGFCLFVLAFVGNKLDYAKESCNAVYS